MTIPFVKTQTVGNDFVLFRDEDVEGLDLAALAAATGDRHFGVGHDGMLVAWPEDGGGLGLRFFNPDGSEDFCGNGIRCAGLFAFEEGWCGREFLIRQLGREVPVRVDEGLVTSLMPGATLEPSLVPVVSDEPWVEREVLGVVGTAVSTGSTHFVAMVDSLPETPWFERTSSKIEVAEVFPEKTSVIWTRVDDPWRLSIRIWERGVGETLGCGTGSIAAAAVHCRRLGLSGEIRVANPGGDLVVAVDRWDAPVSVSSRPERVFEGEFPFDQRLDR